MLNRPLRVVLACSLACASGVQSVSAQDEREMATEARRYLDQVLDIIEAESLNRARLDWSELRAAAYEMAADAQSPEDTYGAITYVVGRLGDRHSRFIPTLSYLARMAQVPEEAFRAAVERPGTEPSSRRAHPRVGLIHVPAFSGPEPDEFARRIADRLRDVVSPDICAWIVDVRGNTGGNMWPMLQGLRPLLGDVDPGYFVYPDGTWNAWSVESAVEQATLSHDPAAVAVLHDNRTASSGEAVVVAFRGRPQARTFGQPTAGLSTANRSIELPDGARLLLTVAVYADRNRSQYGGAIVPDETLDTALSEEEVLLHVQSWLLRQDPCEESEEPGFSTENRVSMAQ
jgi:carboxyl-terminal processing protease